MTSLTFFLIFIPCLAFVLLAVNLIFAPHNPYQEKDSAFECGFHSFLGQNRTQFNISFFIFALLFLLFDLEIVLVYPYIVSGYVNSLYGLVVLLVFFVILTLGFGFEFGKNALKIENRQTDGIKQNITEIVSLCRNNAPKPHLSVALPLESKLNLLNTDKYIISPALQNVLQSGKLSLPDAYLDTKDKYPKGLYLIMFKVINLDSRVLFYNYIYYPDIFLPVVFNYMYNRVNISDSITQQEWGNYLVFFDDVLMLKHEDKKYTNLFNINIYDSCLVTDTGSINFINKLTGLCNNETIYNIINLAYNKDHKHSDVLLNKIKNSNTVGGLNDKLPNLIDSCLFIVHDLDVFINSLKNKNSLTNCGPQSLRGQVSSLNNFLNCIDIDFRTSLYNHNSYHVKSKNLGSKFLLPRDRFTFNNIHINIGGVKI